MVSMKTSGLFILFCVACFFACSSGRELKKRDAAETTTSTMMDSTENPGSNTGTVKPTVEQEGVETASEVESLTTTEQESSEEESSEERNEDDERHFGNRHWHGREMYPNPGMATSFLFDSPVSNFRQMEEYFRMLERTMRRIFEQTMSEAEELPNAVSNTTTRELTIDGKKYNVEKTIVKGGTDNSSVFIKSVHIVPLDNQNNTIIPK